MNDYFDLEEEVTFDENNIFMTIPATIASHSYIHTGGHSPTCHCGNCDCFTHNTLIYGYKCILKQIIHTCIDCVKKRERYNREYSTNYTRYHNDYNYSDDDKYYDVVNEYTTCDHCDVDITYIPHVTRYEYYTPIVCENCSLTCHSQIPESRLTNRFKNGKKKYFECIKCNNIFNYKYLTDENGYALYSDCCNQDYRTNCYPIRCTEKFNKFLLGHNKDCSDFPIINSIDWYIDSYFEKPGRMFSESDEKWEKKQRDIIINAKKQNQDELKYGLNNV